MLPCAVRPVSLASYFGPIFYFRRREEKIVCAPAGNQTRVSSVAGTYTITVLPALIVLWADTIFTQSDKLCASPRECTSKCNVSRSYGAMAARWFPDPKVGSSNPSSFMFVFFGCLTDDATPKRKTNCRNWESHPGYRGHNAESCY